MKNHFFLSLLVVLLTHTAIAQSYSGKVQLGSSSNDGVNELHVDKNGNIYVTGFFYDAVDFDPGPGSTVLNPNSSTSGYIAKYDSNNNLLWVKQVAFAAHNLKVDDNGNLFFSGSFFSTVDFDPGPAVHNLTSINNTDLFVLKLDSNADFKWVKSFGGAKPNGIRNITFDSSKNIYVTGWFRDSADFDPGPLVFQLYAVQAEFAFISKLDSSGSFLWAKSFSGSSSASSLGQDLVVGEDSSLIVVGGFDGTIDFDPGNSISNLTYTGNGGGAYIVKLDLNGNFIFAKSYGGGNGVGIQSVLTNKEGQLFMFGIFIGNVDFNPGSGTNMMNSGINSDAYVLKLDSMGNYLNVAAFDGNSGVFASDFKMDKMGNLYLYGSFNDTIDFRPNSGSYTKVSNGLKDIYLAKLDSSLNFINAITFGGIREEEARSLAFNSASTIYYGGAFGDTVDFDFGTSTDLAYSNGQNDGFFASYSQCLLDASISANNNILMSNQSNASYQWLDCNNGYSILPNDTNQTFVASSNGSYAVEISKNNCVDTSQCAFVLNVGLENFRNSDWVKVYPNPTAQNVIIETDQAAIEYTLMDMMGKVIKSGKLFGNKTVLQLNVTDGIYYLRIRKKQNSQVIKLIKN